MAAGLKNPKVTAYAVAWVRQQRDAGRTWQAIADDLGLTKQQIIRMEGGGVGAGNETEDALARLLHAGSIDALRAAAEKHWQEHPELQGTVVVYDDQFPQRVRAVDAARRLGSVSEAAIEQVLSIRYHRDELAREITADEWLDKMRAAQKDIDRGLQPPKVPQRERPPDDGMEEESPINLYFAAQEHGEKRPYKVWFKEWKKKGRKR